MKIMGSPLGPRMVVDGHQVDYFCGTSYYTLHGDPRVIDAACRATREYGMGPATHMTSPPLVEVEQAAARFFDTEAAAYIISGYLTDMTLLQALRDEYQTIFVDGAGHYSLFDGLMSTGKRIVRVHHLDVADLERALRAELRPGELPLVATDGVFPVTGAIAPLAEYARLLEGYAGGLLCVDDSHALGVIGEKGQGSLEYCGVQGEGRYVAGTLSKAFGGLGGIIPGPRSLIEKIGANARVPVGASPPTSGAAAAAAMGIKILSENPQMRTRLWENVARVRGGLRRLGVDTGDSPIPIVAVHGVRGIDLSRVQLELERQGILVAYVPPHGYSDAPGTGLLRVAVFSTHTDAQLDRLLEALGRLI